MNPYPKVYNYKYKIVSQIEINKFLNNLYKKFYKEDNEVKKGESNDK